jgi:hypothetical protein
LQNTAVSIGASFLSPTVANDAQPSLSPGCALNSEPRLAHLAICTFASFVQPLVLSGFVDLAGLSSIGGLLNRQDASGEACLLEKFTRSFSLPNLGRAPFSKIAKYLVTIPGRAALLLVPNSMKRTADVTKGATQLLLDGRVLPALTLRSKILPRNQAASTSRSGLRLVPSNSGAQKQDERSALQQRLSMGVAISFADNLSMGQASYRAPLGSMGHSCWRSHRQPDALEPLAFFAVCALAQQRLDWNDCPLAGTVGLGTAAAELNQQRSLRGPRR